MSFDSTEVSANVTVRVLEPQIAQATKQAVRSYLAGALTYSSLSEQVWLVTLARDGTLRGRVCCYVGERATAPDYCRRAVLAMLQSGARRFVVVHYFPSASDEGELVAQSVALRLQNVEAALDVEIVDQFIVNGRGEFTWWRSLVTGD